MWHVQVHVVVCGLILRPSHQPQRLNREFLAEELCLWWSVLVTELTRLNCLRGGLQQSVHSLSANKLLFLRFIQVSAQWCRMCQRKMLRFSARSLLLLLPWFGGLVTGEISNDFSQCLDFFYNKTPPKGINAAGYQPICQRYKNKYRFASLYQRKHRIPLYSAYILSPANGKRPSNIWKYEPQVSKFILFFYRGVVAELSVFIQIMNRRSHGHIKILHRHVDLMGFYFGAVR